MQNLWIYQNIQEIVMDYLFHKQPQMPSHGRAFLAMFATQGLVPPISEVQVVAIKTKRQDELHDTPWPGPD